MIISILLFMVIGCENHHDPTPISQQQLDELLLAANKVAVKKEANQIDAYIKTKNLEIITTGTGLRYQIYHRGDGNLAKAGKTAIVSYEVSLLDGTICYTTKEGNDEFLIGNDNVESGLHEAITYLRTGDKAIVILPSHLAHGLAGNFDKIPMRSTIVYDIELIAFK